MVKKIHVSCISCLFLIVLLFVSIHLFTDFSFKEQQNKKLIVKIKTGYLNGRERHTVLKGKKYYSFQGIPYANPPIGELRFKDPVPMEPWDNVQDATKHGEVCMQYTNLSDSKVIGSEDCLFLNVYTPLLPRTEFVIYKPVMVWIHGGGFTFGSGNDDMYGPDFLIEEGVVVVTLNYRLGVLGFLNLGIQEAPGNVGLKDQNLALRWVQENITQFGGNPDSITLFGQSSGAASVHYHTLSTMSKGLFHKVIMQSGCALNPWAYSEEPQNHAFELGLVLGISTKNPTILAEFLRGQQADTLINKQEKSLTIQVHRTDNIAILTQAYYTAFTIFEERRRLTFPFVPSMEISGTGMNFLTEHPEILMKTQRSANVPYIIGMTDKEGLILLPDSEHISMIFDDNSHGRFVPRDLCNKCRKLDFFNTEITKFYFENNYISKRNIQQYVDLCSDLEFNIGIQRTIKLLSATSSISVYVYLFTFDGQLGAKSFIPRNVASSFSISGASHSDDIGYVFKNNFGSNELTVSRNGPEMIVIENITHFWTTFAKESDPTSNEKLDFIKWRKTTVDSPKYLEFGEHLRYIDGIGIFPQRTLFWEKLYENSIKE